MSQLKITNRIPEMVDAILTTADERTRQKEAGKAAEKAGVRVLRIMRKTAPEGKEEKAINLPDGTTIKHDRPSIRLRHGTLEEGWGNPEVEKIDDGASFRIISNAPHMKYLLFGASSHPIAAVNAKFLVFWWFKKSRGFVGEELPKGHPGFRPSTFVEESLGPQKGRQIIQASLDEGAWNVLNPIREFFS